MGHAVYRGIPFLRISEIKVEDFIFKDVEEVANYAASYESGLLMKASSKTLWAKVRVR